MKAEIAALWDIYRNKTNIYHISHLENNLGLGKYYQKFKGTYKIATAHQPPGWWKLGPAKPEIVQAVNKLIVLDNLSKEYFSTFIPPENIDVIQHGVNTNFFIPKDDGKTEEKKEIRCLFSGQWLRDLDKIKSNNRIYKQGRKRI